MKRLTLLNNGYSNPNQLTFELSESAPQDVMISEIADLDIEDNDESIFEADMPEGFAATLDDENSLLVALLDYNGDVIEQSHARTTKEAHRQALKMANDVEDAIFLYPRAERVVVRNAQGETVSEVEISRTESEEFAEAY